MRGDDNARLGRRDAEKMTLNETLKELERLEKEATPGPWRATGKYKQTQDYAVETPDGIYWAIGDAIYHTSNNNHEFIAISRNSLPKLIQALRLAMEALKRSFEMGVCIKEKPEDSDLECPHCFQFEAIEKINALFAAPAEGDG